MCVNTPLPNNSMQRTALRAAADAGRWASQTMLHPGRASLRRVFSRGTAPRFASTPESRPKPRPCPADGCASGPRWRSRPVSASACRRPLPTLGALRVLHRAWCLLSCTKASFSPYQPRRPTRRSIGRAKARRLPLR
jgi:hypothetical protein